jgi:hypothetical protein
MSGVGARGKLGGSATAALVFLVLVAAAFWPVVAGTRSFFHVDLYYEHLPVWEATQRALVSGESPFWLDGEYCGQPALFIQEAPLFYPPTVPLLLTGAPVARLADLFSLFHYWLAGFAVFLLLRELTGRAAAGYFGGVAWMLSARMVQSAIWPNAVAASALVPLGLYGLVRIARGSRRAGVLWAAAAGGLALLAARPQVLLAAAPIVACLAAALWWTAARRPQALRDFGLAALLALALGAPSLVPTAALLPETSRSAGLPAGATDLQPLASGHELDMVFLPVDGRTRWPESAAYPGVLVYALALSGAFAFVRRNALPERAAFAGSVLGAAAGLVLAFGATGPYRYLAELPVLRGFRVPERFLLSWSLGLVLAASLAFAHWLGRVRRPRLLAAVCLLGLAADLVAHARRAAPTAEARLYSVEPAMLPALRRQLERDEAGFPRRFLSAAGSPNVAPYPDSVRLELLREAGALKGALGMRFGLESSHGAGPALMRVEEVLGHPTERALALAATAVVVLEGRDAAGAPSPIVPPVMTLAAALPRAFLAPEAVVVPAPEAMGAALSDRIDPRRTVVLEEGEPLARDPAWSDAAAAVRLISRSPSRVALETKGSAPSMLVLLDAHESGWRATVDGSAAPVLRADAAFRAVRLPAGTHRVEFFYVPPGLREGLGLGLAGVLGLVLAAIRLRPAPAPPAPPSF